MKEDLKQQKGYWLVRGSSFSELTGQGNILYLISISQEGLKKLTYSPSGKYSLLDPYYSLTMLVHFAEFTVNKEMRGGKALFLSATKSPGGDYLVEGTNMTQNMYKALTL